MRDRPTAGQPERPPHPTARQRSWSPDGLPDVVLCTGPAEHYEDNLHEPLKLVLVPGGPFEVRRRGAVHRAAAGQLIALHGDEAHSGGPGEGSAPGWLLMCLPPSRLADAGVRGGRLTFREPALDGVDVVSRYRRLLDVVDRHVATLEKEAAVAGFVAALAGQGLPGPPDEPAGGGTGAGVRAARDYLGDHLDRNVTLAELAATAGMSTFQLVRAFTRTFGLPPHALHLRLRLDRAQDLLRRGHRPADVVHATGFADQSHLTRSFKRLYGVTPSHYRRRAGTGR